MKVIVPNRLTILNSSIAEDNATDGATWASSTSYKVGDLCRKDHLSFRCVTAHSGKDPTVLANNSGTSAVWQPLGATNPYRCIDEYLETRTEGVAGQTLSLSVPFSRANAFCLFGLVGRSLSATVRDSDDENPYLERTWELVDDISELSLFEYNYTEVKQRETVFQHGLPMPITGTLELAIDSDAETPRVGMIIVGMGHDMGRTLWDASVGVSDYSKKEQDSFGRTTLVRRAFASTVSLPIYVHPQAAEQVTKKLKELRATPCVWVGDKRDGGYESLTVYGYLDDWHITFDGPNYCSLSVDIQGLI